MERKMRFDEEPENYDRYRPCYVPELFDDILRYSGLDASKRALEIGVGTGLATPPILKTGCDVTAVEAGRNLAAYSRNKFASYPNFRVVCSDFERFEADEPFDLIYSATAFHWIPEETGYPRAHRLLKPGGAVALFWNRPFVNRPDDALHARIREIYSGYRPSDAAPAEFSGHDGQKIAGALARYGFREIVFKLYHRTRTLRAREYTGLLNTYSDHRSMGESERRGLEAEIEEAIEAFGGELNVYDTMDLYLAKAAN